MRPVGTARRGDVVLVEQIEPWRRQRDMDAFVSGAASLYAETGVTIAVLAPGLRPVNIAPASRFRARRGPTPRWCRR